MTARWTSYGPTDWLRPDGLGHAFCQSTHPPAWLDAATCQPAGACGQLAWADDPAQIVSTAVTPAGGGWLAGLKNCSCVQDTWNTSGTATPQLRPVATATC